MAIRDFLRRLGLLSGEDAGSRRGVRRAGFSQRPADTPTAPVHVPSMAPGSGAKPAVPAPTEMVTPPRPAPAVPPPPVVQPPPAAAPTPPSRDLGGATQYFRTVESEPQALVGILVGIQGPLKGQIYKVHDGENKIGRERCEVLLADPTKRISRFHAKITHMEGALVIEANPDVMENNPTYLNDDAIDAEALNDGDILRFGDCMFKFRTI